MTDFGKVAVGKGRGMPGGSGRVVIIGKNAKVVRQMAGKLRKLIVEFVLLSHSDVANFESKPGDKVWIFSFSRKLEENRQMFENFTKWENSQFFYISTATTNITSLTSCYEYPRVKRQAEMDIQAIASAAIVRIGLVYDDEEQLPSGHNACTPVNQLAAAVASNNIAAQSENGIVHLYEMKQTPFSSSVEKLCFDIYGKLLTIAGSHPCWLRPIDLVLRGFGCRWYGYLYISNRLCLTTI